MATRSKRRSSTTVESTAARDTPRVRPSTCTRTSSPRWAGSRLLAMKPIISGPATARTGIRDTGSNSNFHRNAFRAKNAKSNTAITGASDQRAPAQRSRTCDQSTPRTAYHRQAPATTRPGSNFSSCQVPRRPPTMSLPRQMRHRVACADVVAVPRLPLTTSI